MSTAYSNSPIAESENSNSPTLSLEVQQFHASPTRRVVPVTTSQLHLDLHALYEAGLVAKFYDEDGVERFQPVEW
jgi:hypothetical protein